MQYEAKMNAEKLRKAMHAHCNAALAAAGVTGGGATADSGYVCMCVYVCVYMCMNASLVDRCGSLSDTSNPFM